MKRFIVVSPLNAEDTNGKQNLYLEPECFFIKDNTLYFKVFNIDETEKETYFPIKAFCFDDDNSKEKFSYTFISSEDTDGLKILACLNNDIKGERIPEDKHKDLSEGEEKFYIHEVVTVDNEKIEDILDIANFMTANVSSNETDLLLFKMFSLDKEDIPADKVPFKTIMPGAELTLLKMPRSVDPDEVLKNGNYKDYAYSINPSKKAYKLESLRQNAKRVALK